MEEWKMITDFEGYYEVSSHGRVRSLDRTINSKTGATYKLKGRILSPAIHNTGYNNVNLSKNGEKTYVGVHRLVALHFVDNPGNKDIVNHINEIRNDNHYINLEWVTHGENLAHNGAFERGREKIKKPVFQYTLDGEFVRKYSFAQEVLEYGFRPNAVAQVCGGHKKTHYGFIWKYHQR